MKQYRVFGTTIGASSTGGKRFTVVDGSGFSEAAMMRVTAEADTPLTAFITDHDANEAQVRYFAVSGKEKLESDSGALVVAHHLGRSCRVVSPGGALTVTLEDGLYWTAQGDHHVLPLALTPLAWLDTLQLRDDALEPDLTMLCAGMVDRHNVVVPVLEATLNKIKPDWELLAAQLLEAGANGLIAAVMNSSRANLDYRFFAPHRGLKEDNAGSFTLASLCGYRAAHTSSGVYDLTAAQGYASGKPSSLRARFIARDSVALAVRVGGRVEDVV